MKKQAKILGTGSYLPSRILSNADLEKMVDTTDDWIFTRTGMKERRIAAEGENTSDLGVFAAQKAIEDAGVAYNQIDFILVATLTPDYPFPSTACLIQAKLGLEKVPAVDIQAACTGYIYALSLAKALVENGAARLVLIVAPEKLSAIVDYTDRATCVLFGDGSAACVVGTEVSQGKKGKTLDLYLPSLGADGTLPDILKMPAGGSCHPATHETVEQKLHSIKMEGKEVFKHAVRRMEASSKEAIELAGLAEDQIDWLIPHQANIRIIEALEKRFNIAPEKVFITLSKYGNTSASSVAIALDELLKGGRVSSGDYLLLTAFGAGLTWGSVVLKYE